MATLQDAQAVTESTGKATECTHLDRGYDFPSNQMELVIRPAHFLTIIPGYDVRQKIQTSQGDF